MSLSERVQLLGAGLYTDIPDELTLTSIPTVSELDYVGNEDFDKTMLDSILPKAVPKRSTFVICLRSITSGSAVASGCSTTAPTLHPT